MSAPPLRIRLFGRLRILLCDHGDAVELGPHAGALLARLALEPRRSFTREELIDFLWPDDDVEEGRRKLRQLAYSIHHHLGQAGYAGPNLLLSTRSTLQLNLEVADVDAIEFRRHIRTARQSQAACDQVSSYEAAVDLYTGELLAGYYQDEFTAERGRYAEECYQALRGLARSSEQLGNIDRAMDASRRAVELNPTGEEAHCDLMRYHALKGELSAVLRQYRDMERILRDELGADPSTTARDLRTRLRQGDLASTSEAVAAELPRASSELARTPPALEFSRVPRRALDRRHRRTIGFGIVAAVLLVSLASFGLLRHRTPAAARFVAPLAPSYSKEPLWVARYRGGPGDKDSEPQAIVTDRDGNSYVAGFIDTVRSDVDFLVIKYDRDGKQLWEYRYNGPGNDVDRARWIALDKAGNVYVTGDSDNGKGNGLTRLSGLDFATIKLGPDGKPSPSWPDIGCGAGVRRYNGPADGRDESKKLLVDGSGGVYVMGNSYNRKEARDWAIIKYDSGGRLVWSERYDGPAHDEDCVNDMTLSPDGGLYATGMTTSRMGDSPESDVLTIKYDEVTGREIWSRVWGRGNHADDGGKFVKLDKMGMIYVLGEGATAAGTYNHDRTGCLTLVYDSSGKLLRARGAASDGDHLDTLRGAEGWGAVFGEAGTMNRILLRDEAGKPTWVRDFHRDGGTDNGFIASAFGHFLYVTGSLPDPARCPPAREVDYATIALDMEGSIRREWFYHGIGGAPAVDFARAIAVVPGAGQPGPSGERVLVTGQSTSGRGRDMVTVCYSAY